MPYFPLLTPRAHQAAALQKAAGRRAFAYLMDMRTGKSKVVLDEFGALEDANEVSDLLIVAPAGCYRNWNMDRSDIQISEINKHIPPSLKERLLVYRFEAGMGVRAKKELELFLRNPRKQPRIFIVNVEALSRVKLAIDAVADFLKPRRAYMAIDEATVMKNSDADRTKNIVNFGASAPYRRILSGLITPNSPMDLFAPFEFLDWRIFGQRSFFGFRGRYAITKKLDLQPKIDEKTGLEKKGRSATIIVGYRNLDELESRVSAHSYRCRMEDCLDLPGKTYSIYEVEMTKEQERVYKEVRAQAYALLDRGGSVSVQLPITMLLRLHQILCGHVTDDAGTLRALDNKRLDGLMEILNLSPRPRKVVVWACYDASVREIIARIQRDYGPQSVAGFWGGNAKTRGEDEARFLSDPDCRFLVATQSAGGRGNTWVVADTNVYYASTHNLDHRAQSEERSYGDQQKSPLAIVDMLVPETVDWKIVYALRKKIDIAAQIQGDGYRKWIV